MGDGVRDRIWKYLDEPEFREHAVLRDALYRLLVAIEATDGALTVQTERSLDVAAAAVRDGNAAAVTHACALVDDVVARVATIKLSRTIVATRPPSFGEARIGWWGPAHECE